MTKTVKILTARNSFLVTLVVAAIILFLLAPKSAVNVDEQLHYPHAKNVVNWYFTGGEDTSCLNTPVTNLKYYGQSVDNFTALFNRIFEIENEFVVRHYTGAFFFWLMLVFAGIIGYQLSKNYWIAMLTVVTILFMPRLFGQAFGNLKDIPFATGYVAGISMIIQFIKELPKVRWSTTILLGLAIAFTCSVRIGGLILFAYLALAIVTYFILKPFFLKHIVSTKLCFVRLLGQGVVIAGIGYFIGLLFWPYALQDVFQNPLQSLRVMEHYKVSIRQIFNGKLFWSTQLPWYYLPKWILISTPEFILLGFLLGFISLFSYILKPIKSKQLFLELFVFFTLLFPIFYVIIIDSNLYSGIRQMFFVFPIMAVISSKGIIKFWNSSLKQITKIPVLGLFFVLMIFPLKNQATTFPADYIYFNMVSGGAKKAWSNFEYDYYFHGIKNSSEYLLNEIGDKHIVVASNCNLSNYFEKHANVKFQYTRYLERSSVDWDYGVFGVNYIHPFQLKNKTWQSSQIIKTFYHQGNPVAVLLKRSDKNDFNGISKLNGGNYQKGKLLVEQALEADPKNIWLFVHLMKKCIKTKEFDKFEEYFEVGLNLHPYYEPLYLLRAQKLFDEKKYTESLEVLDYLKEINPRYKNAAPLLKAVNEKLNK